MQKSDCKLYCGDGYNSNSSMPPANIETMVRAREDRELERKINSNLDVTPDNDECLDRK